MIPEISGIVERKKDISPKCQRESFLIPSLAHRASVFVVPFQATFSRSSAPSASRSSSSAPIVPVGLDRATLPAGLIW